MSTFSRTATLFSTVVLGSMLATTTVSSVNTVINAAETTQAATTKKNYDLKILQGNSDATSTASQFYLNTISLEKLADGNYYAYLTSNTPVSLGDDPISSEDTQHQVVKMGTTQKNGYNQTVYRLTLTADELASGQPIKTKIHVNIPMMNYDHEYDIRLAIQGFKPETTTSSNSSVSSSTVSSSSVSSSSTASSNDDQTSVSSPTSSVSSTKNSQSTSVSSSSTTSVSDNDTTVSTVDNSQTDESKSTDANDSNQVSAGEAVKMTADQGMDKFFNSTAHINVKGDKTDVTISLLDDKTVGMIPYITLDGQKKSVTSQDTTFTIPTKDLQADKNGQVTLKSTTHVDAMGYVHDYPSNLTFNVGDLTATQDTFKTGDYQINVSPDSQMDKFFAPKFNVKIGDQTSVVSVTYGVPDMMSMIPSVTFDGQTKDTDSKTSVDFTIPTKDLIPDKDGKVTIASFTSVPKSPSKGYSSNITFDMTPALINAPSDNDSSSSSSSESTATSDKDILQDGTYSINYNVYKSGTTDDSTMKTYMTESAKVNVKDGEATIDFATKNDAMSMMKKFSINGVTAKAKDDSWVVTVPVKDLNKTLTAEMTIYVAAINFTETPSADIVFDMKSIKNVATDDSSSSSVASSSQSSQSSSSAASTSRSSQSSSSATSTSKSSQSSSSAASTSKPSQSSSSATSTSKPSQSSSSATSTSKPSQSSSSATSTSKPSQSSSSATSTSKPSQSSSSASSVSKPSSSSSSATSESKPTPAQPDIQKDGKYAINYDVYKSGTTTDSAMANYMTKSAKVTVKNGKATINFETKNDAMSMMKQFSVNGVDAEAKGDSWIVTLPAKDLTNTLKADMTIYVAQLNYTEKPSADISFDMNSIKDISSDDGAADSSSDSQVSSSSASSVSKPSSSSSSAASTSQSSQSSSSATSTSKPSQSSSSATSTSKPSQSSSSATSTSKPSQSSSSATSTSKPSQSSSSATSESKPTPAQPDIQKDGKYAINYDVYKSGTTTDSAMVNYMTKSAKVTVKNGEATINFETKNDAMSMMKQFSVNGVDAEAKGDSWIVTLPAKDLTNTLKADMTIYVAQLNYTEKPSADISFDMNSIKDISSDDGAADSSSDSQVSSSSAASTSKPSQSSSSASSVSKPNSSSSSATSTSQPEQLLTTDFKDGTYNVKYHIYKSGTTTDSTMANYMTESAKVTIKNGKATITFATKNSAMSMMKQLSVNDTKATANGNNWIVTLPAKDLAKTLTAHMHIEVPQIGLTEDPDADIKFDIAKGTSSQSSSSATSTSQSSQSSSSAASTSQSSQSSSKPANINKDGRYQIGYQVYKTGTHTPSTMQQYMTSTAIVDVKNGQATIYFKTKNGAMSLMTAFAVNGHKAQAKENGWQVTLPVSDLLHTLKSNMTIYVPTLNFTENPSADIVFNIQSIQPTKQPSNLGKNIIPKADTNQKDNSASQNYLGIPNATLHQLTILQSNSNSTSVAAQYFLPTIQLRHNKNGSYTGYITTHTPVMMGRNPISFMDSRHQVKRISTIKTGNYYQSTYELQFSENEIKAPIATQIHVQFTSPLQYDHIYTIRLVIGRALSSASEATQPTTGLPDASGLTTSPLSSDVSRGTSFTPLNNATTTSKGNTQNNAKAKSHTKSHAKKNSHVTKDTQDDSKNDNTTQRNVLIVAGGILAAALGYVGVALLTNFFKMR